MIQLTVTLKMTTAQVVETSVTVNNNSPIQDYVHQDDQIQPFEIIIIAALKILFFEPLREHGLIEEVPPWYSPVMPKPAYQNTTSEAFFGIFPSMQSTTKLEQIGSTRDLSATRGKKSAQLK